MEASPKNYTDLINKLIEGFAVEDKDTFILSKRVFLEIGTQRPEFILEKIIFICE
jgi:hypothetical protein